ncbi:HD family phosphohydrolase [Parabacteroides bouchesdurhonensis]|uniref:HD family phosphohydrolase n=1 Tax=Parabacteroides bouchesdurhonensis TaxID=1936995 RepID=UPI000C8493F9|nr:HDIG domain-containing metalloprotein [Parabacteroides bouchesdurhonensis]
MKLKNYSIPSAIYFIVAALLIAYFFPREGKFRYQFYEGKPWRYGLLTAPGDFPIYKTDEEVKAEKDSILKKFEPYYRQDKEVETSEIAKLRSNYNSTLQGKVSPAYMQYIEKSLVYLYNNGIVTTQELDDLKKEDHQRVNLLENNIATPRYVSEFFTVKTAYEYIINNCPAYLDKAILQSCDINNYLRENVTYDQSTSEKVRTDILQSVAISNGMVQAGERIVDRGEIVDHHTYNVLRSLKIVHEIKSGGSQRQSIILGGQFVLVFGIMFCFWMYLWSFRPKIFNNRKNTFFLLSCIFTASILTELCVTYGLFNVYILPYAIIPIVVRTFFDSRTALFTHIVTVLMCSLMAPFPHEFLLLQIIAGMVVTFSLKELSQRSQLIRCAVFIFLSYTIVYISLTLYQEADFKKINWMMMLYFGINFILLMFTYVLVYMLEKTFGYVSSITLVELSNINNPILKKLSETCPGTFQHSLQVSILASEAAAAIGANTQLVRTGAMYHDIGKMANPVFFTENQNSVNPHDKLAFDESAQIIINHVTDGVRIAEKAGLPKAIINFIRTHHGRGKAKYFYNSFKNRFPDKEVNDELFTYPGPNPFTKETAVLMMADSVEAASRSLKEHTEEGIRELVDKIIDGQIADGLLKNTPLTYKDVETIKDVFVEKLKIMYHTRISYPDLKK